MTHASAPPPSSPPRQALSGAPPLLDAVVVGAGISGLTTAYRLQCAGLAVQLLDAAVRPGGVVASVLHEGCLFERGPNSALDTTPLIAELVADLGLAGQFRMASATADKRYVVRGGRLTPLPTSPGAFFATPLFSARAKLALLREIFVAPAPAQAEESIAQFVRRRLGSEFLDYAIDPFVAGVYAGDPESISVRAAFPRLHALEQRWGSLVRGQVLGARERRRQKAVAKNTAKSFSFALGMQQLTDALAAALGGLHMQTRVLRIERDAAGPFTLHAEQAGVPQHWRARTLVLAVPADAAAALVQPHCADAAAALDSIAYAPVATVASAYARQDVGHALDGFGCLVPRQESRRVLGVLFSSSMFEGRAPAGKVLLTTFIGGQRQPLMAQLPESDIADLAHQEHAALLGATGQPRFQAVTRWPRAIPQYTLGHLGRVERAEAARRALPGLFFCANWTGGVAVGDCIRNGHLQAQAVQDWLRGRP